MKKIFAFAAALVMSLSIFADRDVIPTSANVTADLTTTVVFAVYFDGTVCNDLYAVGSFNSWSTELGDNTTLLKVRPITGCSGWYYVNIPYAADLKGKICQLTGDGSWSWGTQAQGWVKAGADNKELGEFDGDGNCYFPEPGLYTYYSESFQGNPCSSATFMIKVYAPDCEVVVPTIAGDFNNWGNDSDADTDMDIDFDDDGEMYYYKEIVNGIGAYKLRGGYGWGNNIEVFDEATETWTAAFPNNVALADTTYDFRDPAKYRYASCEVDVEKDYELTFTNIPVCGEAQLAVVGGFAACNWDLTKVVMVPADGKVTINAKNSDQFKLLDATTGDWTNEVNFEQTSFTAADGNGDAKIEIDLAGKQFAACLADAVENVAVKATAVKYIENGQLIIEIEGVRYNALGAKL